MNIPLSVLVEALEALKLAHADIAVREAASSKTYIALVRAKAHLGHYVEKMASQVPVEVREQP